MSFSLLSYVFSLDEIDDFHLARMLILVDVLSGKKQNQKILGINRLAKLDFFLRYPTVLERSLIELEKNTDKIQIKEYERFSVESAMISYRYGPWDNRYRRFLALLDSRGLISQRVSGNSVEIIVTELGHAIATKFQTIPEFDDYLARSKLIKTHISSLTIERLNDFILKAFPELKNIKWGEKIDL